MPAPHGALSWGPFLFLVVTCCTVVATSACSGSGFAFAPSGVEGPPEPVLGPDSQPPPKTSATGTMEVVDGSARAQGDDRRGADPTPVVDAAIVDGSIVEPRPVTPPASGLLLWLSGDVGVSEVAGHVTQWRDRSGNGNHATQNNES